VAGFGLAGELGAGITLVSETMSKEDRGYGTMLMVMVGALGGAAAATMGKLFAWQTCYIIGGVLGLGLLAMRVGTYESGMFQSTKKNTVERGNFLQLFTDGQRFRKYLACIMMGVPIWFSVGILILQAKEFAKVIGIRDLEIKTIGGTAILWLYLGLAAGDIVSGWLSQVLQSRKKVVLAFLILHTILIVTYVSVRDISAVSYLFLVFMLGASTGYWGLFATIASEQFGTNIRATVATTVPNFVRGAIIPITLSFRYFEGVFGGVQNQQAVVSAALTVGMICSAVGIIAILSLPETFGKDLDYTE
jgi:MFS transporter, putative metabolite:H+ symporter